MTSFFFLNKKLAQKFLVSVNAYPVSTFPLEHNVVGDTIIFYWFCINYYYFKHSIAIVHNFWIYELITVGHENTYLIAVCNKYIYPTKIKHVKKIMKFVLIRRSVMFNSTDENWMHDWMVNRSDVSL